MHIYFTGIGSSSSFIFLADDGVMDDHIRMVLGFMLHPETLGDTPRLFYHANDKECV